MFCYNISFSGRIRRSAFWLTNLSMVVINAILCLLLFSLGVIGGENSVGLIFFLAIIFWLYNVLLSLSLQVRRLHDTGKSGAYILINLIPFGSLILLIFYLSDSTPGTNQYGPNPKGVAPIQG